MTAIKIIFILIIGFTFSANAQDRVDESFAQAAMEKRPPWETRPHMSIFTYGFDKSYIVVANEYAKDSTLKSVPAYISYPYATRKIQVFGPTVSLSITANGNSSDFPINSTWVSPSPVLDSIFKGFMVASLKKIPGRFKRLSQFVIDSIAKNQNRFDLATLQVQIIKNNRIARDWKNVSQLGTITKATDIKKGNFVVYNDWLEINDHVIITFRNKKDTSLIKFEFERPASPLIPFLASFGRDTTTTSLAEYVKKTLEGKISRKETTDEFYRYWPAQQGGGLGDILKKDRIFSDTKLSFTFRKPEPDYVDTSMQYLLASGRIKDSVWQTTGHTLFLSDFKPGAYYTLLVRYKSAPGNMQTYTFHTMPKWYQATKYKYIVAAAIVLAVIGLILLLYRIRLKKEKRKNAYLQNGLRSIRSQLNPHFIFNALSSIQGLINKNDIPGANHYLTEFSSLLRESLRNNDKELVPLDSELKILETYLKLEQLRFHFQYEITIDQAIDKNAIEIPALLLQPLIENAIKHGVAGLQEKGSVTIAFNTNNKNLVVSIADNGNGFIQDAATQGLGLKLTKDRIRLLNQSFKKQPIQLYIETAYNNGTTVHLDFENWL